MTIYQVFFTELDYSPSLWATFSSKALAKKQFDYLIGEYVKDNYKPDHVKPMFATQESVTLRLDYSTGKSLYITVHIHPIEVRKSILTI